MLGRILRAIGVRACLICIGAFVGGASAAYATAQALEPDTIIACAQKTSGTMRYVAEGECRQTEDLLTWNTAGPKGPAGEAGESGPAGPAGADGAVKAYAYVTAGSLDAARSKGIHQVTFTTSTLFSATRPNGIYCFELGFTPSNVISQGVFMSGAPGITANAVAGTPQFDALGCPEGSDAAVGVNPTGPVDQAYFFAIFN